MKKYFLLPFIVLSISACGENDPSSVNFTLNDVGEVSFHTDEQEEFWKDNNVESSLLKYGMGEEEKELPNPINLSWKVTSAKNYIIQISENSDMSNSWEFTTKKKQFNLYNCKTGTKYYWRIIANYKSNSFTSDISTFNVKSGGPRNLLVNGINNIRDIGGYTTDEGKIINQGLIYRSAKMNESSVSTIRYTITDNGIETMRNQLGIKTDIDLRKIEIDEDGVNEIGGLTYSPLGEDINYVNCPMYYEGSAVIGHTSAAKDAFNKENIKKMFETLGNVDNYPIVFHCTQGKDRTGALAYLMETLLGMNINDIYHDYLFTNMSKIGGYCNYKAFSGYNYYLNKLEGESLKEKAFNYLLSIGVSEENINNFINIMVN